MRHDRSLDDAARAVTGRVPGQSRRWWAGLAGLWLAACVWLLAGSAGSIATLRLPDSDDDLRLLQVRDWLDGQSWFDLRQHRLDAAFGGADIHWSRLVDLPLAGIIRLCAPLLGMARAETVAAVTVPLLTLLAAMAVLTMIARRTIAPAAWWWAPLLLLMASPAVGMMSPLRIDHHGWQIVAVLALLLGLVMPERRRGGVLAGIAIAASLTIGVEMLPFLALGVMLAALGWAVDPDEAPRLRGLCVAAGVGTIIGLFAFVAPERRYGLACDALSITYALPLIAGCAVLAMATLRRGTLPVRYGWLVGAGLVVVMVLLLAGGGVCVIDPYHAADPEARRLWLDRVSEALPLWRQDAETLWASLALPAIGIGGAGFMAWRAGGDGRFAEIPALARMTWSGAEAAAGARRPWLAILAMALLSTALALAATRGAVVAQALAVPGAAALGFHGRAWLAARGSMLLRVFGSVLLFLLVSAMLPRLMIAATLSVPETKAATKAGAGDAACMTPRAMAALDVLPPATLFGFLDATPALLLHTHHGGIAGPYHRNGRAIADVMRAWAGTPGAAEAIVRRHRAAYVIACGDPAEAQLYDKRAPDGLHARLMRGVTPAWLEPVGLNKTPWRVWRVRQPLRGGPAAS